MSSTAGTALVTGSPGRVAEVSDALEGAGFATLRVVDLEHLAAACARLEPGSVKCYVQLPVDVRHEATAVVEAMREFLQQGLLQRFDAAAAVLPVLALRATVLLVAGNHPGETLPDDPGARVLMLRVLAHAILAEKEPSGVRVTIVDALRSAGEIAEIALHPRKGPLWTVPGEPEDEPALSYADWKDRVLVHASAERR